MPEKELIVDFMKFCEDSWEPSLKLVETAREQQFARFQAKQMKAKKNAAL
ncbi:MAG: hypothetical protein GY862_29050 [Gammaproteobacteria bacterium]|nr:hypothetical protein [Gammaproteobacteria bacterium]